MRSIHDTCFFCELNMIQNTFVSLRKFALKQLSIKTHNFFTDDPKAFIPGDTIPAGALVQVHYL